MACASGLFSTQGGVGRHRQQRETRPLSVGRAQTIPRGGTQSEGGAGLSRGTQNSSSIQPRCPAGLERNFVHAQRHSAPAAGRRSEPESVAVELKPQGAVRGPTAWSQGLRLVEGSLWSRARRREGCGWSSGLGEIRILTPGLSGCAEEAAFSGVRLLVMELSMFCNAWQRISGSPGFQLEMKGCVPSRCSARLGARSFGCQARTLPRKAVAVPLQV